MGDTGMPKKFSTDLTDYSVQHSEKTGPYADNLDVDAIIVGAGFGKSVVYFTVNDANSICLFSH